MGEIGKNFTNVDATVCEKCNLEKVDNICPIALALLCELNNPSNLGKPGQQSKILTWQCPKNGKTISVYQDKNSVTRLLNHKGTEKPLQDWINLIATFSSSII